MPRTTTLMTTIGTIAWLFTAQPASAETVAFGYTEPELHSPEGARQLLRRLRQFVHWQCRPQILTPGKAEGRCREELEAELVARIAHPTLARLSRERR